MDSRSFINKIDLLSQLYQITVQNMRLLKARDDSGFNLTMFPINLLAPPSPLYAIHLHTQEADNQSAQPQRHRKIA